MIREITSAQNPTVKHLVKLRHNSDYRYDHHSLVIEGTKLVEELARDHAFKCVIVTHEALLPPGLRSQNVYVVPQHILHKISGLQTSEGIIAEVPMPQPALLTKKTHLIALDGIADPGNLGSLLRSALALGWEGAFILEESCDPFNEKAIRAARGATFRLPLAWGNWDTLKEIIKSNNLKSIVADIEGQNIREMTTKTNTLLVLSNEARGVSQEAKLACHAVTIPMPGAMESLNVAVAGSILMYALGK